NAVERGGHAAEQKLRRKSGDGFLLRHRHHKPNRKPKPMIDSTIGNKTAIAIQERYRRLIRELAIFGVVDSEQAKFIACVGSTTRVNTRLLSLTRAGLLKRAFVGTSAAEE